jgi:hypothetical protein
MKDSTESFFKNPVILRLEKKRPWKRGLKPISPIIKYNKYSIKNKKGMGKALPAVFRISNRR